MNRYLADIPQQETAATILPSRYSLRHRDSIKKYMSSVLATNLT
jgi:hypothetical protein